MPTVLQASATPNNQYLVWDRLTGAFVGTWEGDPLQAAHFFNWMDGDTERAAVVNADGTVRELLVDNCTDDDGEHPGMVFEAAADLGDQEVPSTEVELTVNHHHGAWATFIEADGVEERTDAHQVIPDPEAYKTFGTAAYELDNVNDDQLEPHREDYALLLDETDGVYLYNASGLSLNTRQAWTQRVRFRKALRSLLVRVETMRGYTAIRKIASRMRRKPFARGRST